MCTLGVGERERIPSRLHAQHRAQHGTQSHNSKLMTWAKIKNQMLNWLSHPGALIALLLHCPILELGLLTKLLSISYVINFVNIFFLFLSLFWEREHEKGQVRGRGVEGERKPQAGSTLSSKLDMGLDPTTLGSWLELKSRIRCSTDWATQAPLKQSVS